MTDPASIAAWIAVYPARHVPLLRWFWKVRPERRAAAGEAAPC